MRHRARHHRPKHRVVHPWPPDEAPPDTVAARARYVGSPEHKGSWSPDHVPRLRSDASECPPDLSRDLEANTAALRRAIRHACVGAVFEEGFPKYVWVWMEDALWEARHIRGPAGTYKGYGPLEAAEYPLDPHGRLEAARNDVA